MRILLVEDEPDLGGAIKRTLNQHNYIVDWVLDGDEAWNYLENPFLEYSLGIFDWLLPGLSGIELLQRLRSKNNPLPVLMLTAKDSMEDKVMGLDAGADDYLYLLSNNSDEPGEYNWYIQRNPEQQHKVNISITECVKLQCDNKPKLDTLQFKVRLKLFCVCVLKQMEKIRDLMTEKSFKEHREGQFPYTTFEEFKCTFERVYS